MKNETQLLIDLIKQNKTLNEISNILHLSNKQIFMRISMLKNSGYLVDKKYYYNGEIRYSLHNPFEKKEDNSFEIITDKNTKKIRLMLTSDTHLGHSKDTLECIDSMAEYCINNDIHLVLNIGDFFEGIYKDRDCKFTNPEDQINYALKNYPYDRNILNFVLLGNHDASFWINNGIDIKYVLEERRHDIIPVGYGYGEINIGGAQFRLQHPLIKKYNPTIPNDHLNKIILKGHSHKFKVICPNNHSIIINVPSLSNVPTDSNKNVIPSMIDMELEIGNDNFIINEYFQQFIFINNQFIRTAEFHCHDNLKLKDAVHENQPVVCITENKELSLSQQLQQVIIESANEVKSQNNSDQYKGMNQIEKFEARYQKVLK